ncbi:TolC family protein [Treponema sp. R6D11]
MRKIRYAGGKYPLCLAMLLLLCVGLQAQEDEKTPVKVTLDEAVNLAIKNNLSLESSRTSLATKKRASDLSWNQFIPNITVAGILSRDNEVSDPTVVTFPVPTGAGMPTTLKGISGNFYPSTGFFISDPIDASQWHIVGNIQMSLTVSAAMFENMKRLRIDYEGGLLSYDKAKLQLERDVRKAYHNILLLQENIALMRGSYANVERQVQMAQANYNAGLAPELTLLQARVARENMRPVIDQVENGMKLSMAQFAMFLGLSYDTNFELEPLSDNIGFVSLDVIDTISKASKEKPDIKELRNTIMMLQSARRAQIYALTPSLTLGWNSTSAFIKDPWKDSWFDSSDDWRKSGSFSLTLALRLHSLIPFSTDFQGIKNLDDQIKTATIGLAQLVNGTEIEVYNTVLSLEKTRINTKAQEETVSLAEQSYRLTEEAYRAGLQDYFQVQNAEQSLRQARVQLLEQQFNYLNGLIDLEYSLGVPFGTLSERSK